MPCVWSADALVTWVRGLHWSVRQGPLALAMKRTPHAAANGHRRRQLVARVMAEEDRCIICGQPVDKTLGKLRGQHGSKCTNPECTGCAWHPLSPVVDEDIPRSRGGLSTDRRNTHLAHRQCNADKGDRTLAEHAARRRPATMTTTTLVRW